MISSTAPTVSDPIDFVEDHHNGFDRLDDEQLRNMFADDKPSDQNISTDYNNIIYNQPKSEPGEEPPTDVPPSTIVDPKRIKRILANRQSAQRSRVRKLQYILEFERSSVTNLQTEVSALSPRVAFLDHQRLLLNVDNSALKQRIAALAQDKIFKHAHQEALRKEIEGLQKIYHDQINMKKAAEEDRPTSALANTHSDDE